MSNDDNATRGAHQKPAGNERNDPAKRLFRGLARGTRQGTRGIGVMVARPRVFGALATVLTLTAAAQWALVFFNYWR